MMSGALLRRKGWQRCHWEQSCPPPIRSIAQSEEFKELLLAISPSQYSFLQHQMCIPPAPHTKSFPRLLTRPNSPEVGEQMKLFLQLHSPQPPYPCSRPTPFLLILLKRLPRNSPSKTQQDSRGATRLSLWEKYKHRLCSRLQIHKNPI